MGQMILGAVIQKVCVNVLNGATEVNADRNFTPVIFTIFCCSDVHNLSDFE
jgi:hypothetical protein